MALAAGAGKLMKNTNEMKERNHYIEIGINGIQKFIELKYLLSLSRTPWLSLFLSFAANLHPDMITCDLRVQLLRSHPASRDRSMFSVVGKVNLHLGCTHL